MTWHVTLKNVQVWPPTPSACLCPPKIDTQTPVPKCTPSHTKPTLHCKSGLICQSIVPLLSVGSVWVSDEGYVCREKSKCERVCACEYAVVCVCFGVSYLTGVCLHRVFTASSVGSFLMRFNSLIVSCGVCSDGTLCVCICPISNRFCPNKFISGCECFIATVLAQLLDFKVAFLCFSSHIIIHW